MFPVFYGCEEGGLTEELANEFKEQVYLVDYIIVGGSVFAGELGWAGQGVGGAGVVRLFGLMENEWAWQGVGREGGSAI